MTNRDGREPWIVCGMLFLATTLSFLDRQVLSVLAPEMLLELDVTLTSYSRVISAFVLSYALMLSLGGYLVDRCGARLGLALSVALWSASSGAHAVVTGAFGLGVARFFLGLGEGICIPALVKGATIWFPPQQRALAIGLANSGATFGALLAPPLSVAAAAAWGWQAPFVWTALLGGLWLLGWDAVCRTLPRWVRTGSAENRVEIRKILGDHLAWRAMAAKFLVDPVTYLYMFWIPQYLTKERGFTSEEIGAKFWVIFLAGAVGSIAAGGISSRLVRRGWKPTRVWIILLSAAAAVTPVSALVTIAPSVGTTFILMCVLMLARGIWQTVFLMFLSDGIPAELLASVTGLSGTAGGVSAMISSLVIGTVVERFSFTPVFVVSGVLYPLATMVLLAGARALPSYWYGRSKSATGGD
jgi:ACS family hexuronate transporter-like MFS transporter